MAQQTAAEAGFFAHPKALIDTDQIGDRTRVWAFAHVTHGAQVGSDCNIGEHVFIEGGASIGNNVTVKNGVSVWARVTVEDNCFLGPYCVFTNDMNPRAYIKKGPESLVPTLVKANSSIGANATIVCGRTIGRFAFIGAGAVVTHDVQDYSMVVGNPARPIGWMCECAEKLPMRATSEVGAICSCQHCGAVFERVASGLAKR
ncbi:N-acetyltransferase [Alloacidobacterium dinghuense]|uniref:N-acetyltransferase n=1 Tax=Alloacidobacterium dinghuense TaxID=2763107 RepID=A0A7G8BDZ1_9BACT|nr:acyltransferase [Alloacidobacterium dinghuense]QNI30761.1 N-acetyltransferase [Alloacidobacterium dinghuense]